MKNIIIQVPDQGATVHFILRAGATSGQAVIVASDDVEIRLAEPVTTTTANNSKAASKKAPIRDLDAIFERLTKLKPTKRATAVNSIKTMFQFTAPIGDDEANEVLEALCSRGRISIDAKDKLQIRSA